MTDRLDRQRRVKPEPPIVFIKILWERNGVSEVKEGNTENNECWVLWFFISNIVTDMEQLLMLRSQLWTVCFTCNTLLFKILQLRYGCACTCI